MTFQLPIMKVDSVVNKLYAIYRHVKDSWTLYDVNHILICIITVYYSVHSRLGDKYSSDEAKTVLDKATEDVVAYGTDTEFDPTLVVIVTFENVVPFPGKKVSCPLNYGINI